MAELGVLTMNGPSLQQFDGGELSTALDAGWANESVVAHEKFYFRFLGWGLSAGDRLRVVHENISCGDSRTPGKYATTWDAGTAEGTPCAQLLQPSPYWHKGRQGDQCASQVCCAYA